MEPISKWWFGALCFCIYVPLCMVRKVEKLAATHLFGDIMIIFTVIVIFVYAGIAVGTNGGFSAGEIKAINWELFPDAIGFAAYAYEGIGVIIPIQDITEDKENYFKILTYVLLFIGTMYIAFSEFCIFAFGYDSIEASPLITSSLPQDAVFVWVVEILFALNLVFSYPLVIFPANIVIESYLFKGWAKTKKRQWCKNLWRTIMVALTIVIALSVYDSLDKFLSISGALTCSPIAFILPAMFHYKGCAETKGQKRCDIAIICLGTFVMFFCSIYGIYAWNK